MWVVFFSIFAHIVTMIAQKGFDPVEVEPESRDDKRRRVRVAMQYSDDYFD
jgi:hypothetical protein